MTAPRKARKGKQPKWFRPLHAGGDAAARHPYHPQTDPLPKFGSVLIWWRRCCRTAVRRRSGAPTNLQLGHCPKFRCSAQACAKEKV